MAQTPSALGHTPVSSRDDRQTPRRFLSSDPSSGSDGRIHPVQPDGLEAVAGFQMQGAPSPVRRLRDVRELSFETPLSLRPMGAGLAEAGAPAAVLAGAGAPAGSVVVDPSVYPWRAIACLKITVPGQSDIFLGTGWFIGPYTVITAAHVVHRFNAVTGDKGWASQIEVIPGQNGTGNAPYNSAVSSTFYTPTGWAESGLKNMDYGAIILSQGLGATVGSFGYATYSDDDLRAATANLAGYPVVAPDPAQGDGKLWYAAGGIHPLDDSIVDCSIETSGGESGCPIYRNIGDQRYVMAIHTTTLTTGCRGVRISEPVFTNLQNWASMQG